MLYWFEMNAAGADGDGVCSSCLRGALGEVLEPVKQRNCEGVVFFCVRC